MPRLWKVGELARDTGLSIRTLHYYDEIGLLSPSHRTETGHRLYSAADIEWLQQIKSLRQLGFSLEQVQDCLRRSEFSPLEVIRLHIEHLGEQIHLHRQLRERLEAIARAMQTTAAVSVDEFLKIIEGMSMLDRYYTPEQQEQIRKRGEEVGQERIQQVQEEWARLIPAMKAEMDQGTDPADPRVQELTRQWTALVNEFTGGDPGIAAALKKMYEQEPTVRERAGIDPALSDYVGKAIAVAKGNG